jgi:Tol biopolymer transport system component
VTHAPRALLVFGLFAAAGCGSPPKLGVSDLPPLPAYRAGIYTDVNPRWSHDGRRVAFLRSTPDRRLQLFVTDPDMERATAVLEAELVRPDRQYDSQLCRFSSPDTLAWSADDRQIAFERAEWFQFDDGQRLPGTGLWSFDLRTGRVSPLALHPKRYTDLYYYYHTPAWSPDGKYISFIAEGINGQHRIGLRCIANEKPKELSPRFDNYASSDWTAWRMGNDLGRADAPAQPFHPVLVYSQGIFRTQSIPRTASLRCVQPGSAASSLCRELWRISPAQCRDLASVRDRSTSGSVVEPWLGHPVFSPDGRRIAFTLTPDATDVSRSEVWVIDIDSGKARRVSPADRKGYVAPIWIDGRRLGALSPNKQRYNVVSIDIGRGVKRVLGTIETADCDWSPDREEIAYASSPTSRLNSPDDVTTLRIFDTHLKVRGPLQAGAINEVSRIGRQRR